MTRLRPFSGFRSFDDGETWEPSRIVLPDYFNATEQVGETLYDPATDTIFFFENHVDFRNRHPGASPFWPDFHHY